MTTMTWKTLAATAALAVTFCTDGASAAATLRAGDTLSSANAASANGLLPPEILAFYAKGDWANRITEWPDGKMQREKEFVEGTRQNVGRFGVDDQGSIVARADGKSPARIIGLPFSPIDAKSPSAAVEIIWNY